MGLTPFTTDPIQSLRDFIDRLKEIDHDRDRTVMFRGHADAGWAMLPSIMRGSKDLLNDEKDLVRQIISQHPSEFDADFSMFDRLCRMQHYGIATRLLDITTNPLVALYFACLSNYDFPGNGAVMCLNAPIDRRKYYDSDVVSCAANLANLTNDEKDTLSSTKARTLAEFNELKPTKRLLQFIKAEKPYFLPEIRREDLHRPTIVIPKLRNRRIIAQHGAFMLFALDRNAGPKYSKNAKVGKIIIDSEYKDHILTELALVGLTEATLFPEIDRASAHIMSKYSGHPL